MKSDTRQGSSEIPAFYRQRHKLLQSSSSADCVKKRGKYNTRSFYFTIIFYFNYLHKNDATND